MPIIKRGGKWYIDISTPGGKRIRRSAGTESKIEAQKLHDKLKYELWSAENFDEIPDKLWDEAALRWLNEMDTKKSIQNDIQRIRCLTALRGVYLKDLNRSFILDEVGKLTCGNSTKNRYLALIRSILRKCEREWGWLEKAPILKLYKEANKRIRWITKEEAQSLIAALPSTLAEMAKFSLATGLRQNNVLFLEWSQVDLDRRVAWIHADQSKSAQSIGVPLNQQALEVLNNAKGRHPIRVFCNGNTPVKVVSSKSWRKALEKAGIEDFRWHDLRHTWASWSVQSGVPLYALKEMGGWETIQMVQRYAHLAPYHLHEHAEQIDKIMDTNWTQDEILRKNREN